MKIKSIILTIILGIFYPFALIFPVSKNRITFISLEHDNLSKDFKLIYDRLNDEKKYDLRTLLFKFEPSFWGNIKYGWACVRQLFLIESSRLVIIDYNNFVVSKFPHRKKVKVLQLWHATGALKKFGNDVDRDYVVNHYDYAIANSDFLKPIFARAFNMKEEQVFVTGIPNNDKIFDENFVNQTYQRLLEKYPILKGKKIVTYAPTFRGRISTHFREVLIDLEKVHQKLGDDYLIIYKSHPLISHSDYEKNERVLFIQDELISSLFCVTDILVTDYSAIAIDWMVFDKPIIAYSPDLIRYSHKPGFTIDYENEFPGSVTKNEDELAEAIKSVSKNADRDSLKRKNFTDKMYKFNDGKSTDRVLELIESVMNG
ncbi:CDP-glycerol glycerophosphotransferase family protein [Lactococcus lactis]|uniref:CDP-glycerol glycerophosphotransferase family protein n=1 Tax=Lactococcus lactis TaxID=1358 RepID=UPI000559A802|nr:CDP-glycerol glycerophosphotransferase family protein [Lactococcus lactis]AJA56780.1 teichoic acid biosynthesis protein B [Lactococcus lactis subsp. lactis]WBM78357.1 CDP-glycerol glycerophosphotransferase family protein [Lactococcus lactis]WSP32807.1 CDP-glycerol glycerophosphotransferase family protein [Lactococcus lactis subsp. lactis]